MNENIVDKIESLPPLPKTIIEIEEFRQQPDKEPFDLLKIIEKDALIVSTLLKVSNSAMFGFRSKVETASKAISLLGINFTISIAIGGTIQNLLKTNLKPYGISSDDFMRASNLATTLASLWLNKVSFDLKEELALPALLQETGKFVLSDVIASCEKTEEFEELLSSGKTVAEAEEEITGTTTSEITARIFKHWKLSENLINVIEYIDDIEKCKPEYLHKTQILSVVKTICDVRDTFSDNSIKKGLLEAKKYNLNTIALQDAIDKLQERLLDE
ncbi:HDOD domain-containing protein [Halarcobacter anaerophilus]|uniref:HDOD domain-containing protein n=1 Tax=Halarcobacter anaerophilus TaxID=877500 RepID=UPI0005C8E880|nr:HDOD domain-containing protein [Halarcobacter anaerophilus]